MVEFRNKNLIAEGRLRGFMCLRRHGGGKLKLKNVYDILGRPVNDFIENSI